MRSNVLAWYTLLSLPVRYGVEAAITVDLNSPDSIKGAAGTVAYDLMSYYTGNKTGGTPVGVLPGPYFWWEAGAMWGTMVNYWYYTGDTTYNDVTMQGLLSQASPTEDFMPVNQQIDEGNDDQGFWGMAAMSAAEVKFPDPPGNSPGWLALAQGVFNDQSNLWDTATCNGGLRWQIFPLNKGYTYKNSIANGCLFNIASRLALYTGNQSYADWADKTWDWMSGIGLISSDYAVWDGADIGDNCTVITHAQWSYNAGIYLLGAAAMYNFTNGSPVWEARVNGLLTAANVFFTSNGVMAEGCENGVVPCDTDQLSFKAYLARWMAATTQLAPFTHNTIMGKLATSTTAAVQTCTGGANGRMCGMKWTTGANDGTSGVGQQMDVLEHLLGNLVGEAPAWVSQVKGTGTSKGNINAGQGNRNGSQFYIAPATLGDKVGAGFLTIAAIVGVIAGTMTLTIS